MRRGAKTLGSLMGFNMAFLHANHRIFSPKSASLQPLTAGSNSSQIVVTKSNPIGLPWPAGSAHNAAWKRVRAD
jgi:hypothetical protein